MRGSLSKTSWLQPPHVCVESDPRSSFFKENFESLVQVLYINMLHLTKDELRFWRMPWRQETMPSIIKGESYEDYYKSRPYAVFQII